GPAARAANSRSTRDPLRSNCPPPLLVRQDVPYSGGSACDRAAVKALMCCSYYHLWGRRAMVWRAPPGLRSHRRGAPVARCGAPRAAPPPRLEALWGEWVPHLRCRCLGRLAGSTHARLSREVSAPPKTARRVGSPAAADLGMGARC